MIVGNLPSYPLPECDSRGSLKNSREISFFATDSHEQLAKTWSESLTCISEETPEKGFDLYRRLPTPFDEECSSFYTLLRFLCECKIRASETLVVIGGIWRSAQFALIEELFPDIEINLWLVRIDDVSKLPNKVKKRTGFPTKTTYPSFMSIVLFSDFRSIQFSNIVYDVEFQQKIVDTCVPRVASVRLRPPLRRNSSSDYITFLKGRITTTCCSSSTDIATRVYVTREENYIEGKGFERENYSLCKYEEKMNHYNTEVRSCYQYDIKCVRKSFDAAYQDFICYLYLGKSAHPNEVGLLRERIRFVSIDLSPKL